jgi:hypothetical protein
MSAHVPSHEPHKIKTVRVLWFPTVEERRKHLADARFNVFNLTPRQVTFDILPGPLRVALGTLQLRAESLLLEDRRRHGLPANPRDALPPPPGDRRPPDT